MKEITFTGQSALPQDPYRLTVLIMADGTYKERRFAASNLHDCG
jgi:hypothetical protein